MLPEVGSLESSSPENSSDAKASKLSTRNLLRALGTRFFSQSFSKEEELEESTQSPMVHKDPTFEKKTSSSKKSKSTSKMSPEFKDKDCQMKKSKLVNNRDFIMFKIRYNCKIGNIMRNWISTIYCILVLRTNLIKFLADKVPELQKSQPLFMEQMQVENEVIYRLIRKAQTVSQERFVQLWLLMENMLFNRLTIKKALEALQAKDNLVLEWKAASEKLLQYQQEMEKAQCHCENMKMRLKKSLEMSKLKVSNLATVIQMKDTVIEKYKRLIEEGKKNEILRRERINVNAKYYERIRAKNCSVLKIKKQMSQLKNDEAAMAKEYESRIRNLNSEIEKIVEEIKTAKYEREKMKEAVEKMESVKQEKLLSAGEG